MAEIHPTVVNFVGTDEDAIQEVQDFFDPKENIKLESCSIKMVESQAGVQEVALFKCTAAVYMVTGSVIAEDTRLILNSHGATLVSAVAYSLGNDMQPIVFTGEVKGNIVASQEPEWQSTFQPVGSEKTWAEMPSSEKYFFHPRTIALEKLALFLNADKSLQEKIMKKEEEYIYEDDFIKETYNGVVTVKKRLDKKKLNIIRNFIISQTSVVKEFWQGKFGSIVDKKLLDHALHCLLKERILVNTFDNRICLSKRASIPYVNPFVIFKYNGKSEMANLVFKDKEMRDKEHVRVTSLFFNNALDGIILPDGIGEAETYDIREVNKEESCSFSEIFGRFL